MLLTEHLLKEADSLFSLLAKVSFKLGFFENQKWFLLLHYFFS